MLAAVLCLFILILIIIMDLKTKFSLIRKYTSFALLLVVSHIFIISALFIHYLYDYKYNIFIYSLLIFFVLYFLIRLSFYITVNNTQIPLRLRIMAGGRRLLLMGISAMIIEIPLCITIYYFIKPIAIENWIFITDIVICYTLLFGFALNGAVRIFFTSRRLGLIRRIILLLVMWIPILNIVIAAFYCKSVKDEYEHDCKKIELQNTRVNSQICKTKYPLVLLHGIAFRDLKYMNYWGRIPKTLKENGAVIYYGNQQACGTIEENAKEIKETIYNAMKETGSNKVNIIAHSKGGLEARYLISSLDMGEYVSSLTTMSTPHYGSELINIANRLPDKTFKKAAHFIDKTFNKLGDKNPDTYTSSKQISPEYLKEFNEKNKNNDGVYYQSYAAAMKGIGSDGLLSAPFAVMRQISGNNDGLVSIESAQWGEFKGVLTGKNKRGISHGDLIDLKRQDYNGFDISEEYVKIVADLKNRGF